MPKDQVYRPNGNGNGQPPASGFGPGPQGGDQEHEGLPLRDYLNVLWRRKWVILVVVVVATASAYFFANRQQRVYQAQGTMFYKQQIDLSNPLNGSVTSQDQLDREMATIGDLMAGPEIQQAANAVMRGKGVDTSASYSVTAEQQSSSSAGTSVGSNVVVVTGDSSDPRLAAAAANAFIDAYIAWDADQWRTQIDKALPALQDQLDKYQGDAARLSSDYVLLKQRIQDLQILRATTTGNYRALVPASVPSVPYAPNPMRSAILGFGIGLFAGIGLAFLLEQFDTRVRRAEDVARILRRPILGRVPRIGRHDMHEGPLLTLRHPEGHVAEAFRLVRTNLEFMGVDSDMRSIIITSSMKGEGKSVTVANLAVSMAAAGKKVIVVDADLRRPRQHKLFQLENEKGLSTVIAGKTKLNDALVPVEVSSSPAGSTLDFAAWAGGSDARSRLYVLPSGPTPPNPGELCASRRCAQVLDTLAGEADLVIIDTPAMLAVGDTPALAAHADGLLFLVDLQQVRRPMLYTAADQLFRLPTQLLGTILRAPMGQHAGYYYSPAYYYGYAADGARTKERRRRKYGRRSTDVPGTTGGAAAVNLAPGAADRRAGPSMPAPLVPPKAASGAGVSVSDDRD
jgi:Mrp family chromosome partitioning ATPase/capsular polysaccharide biosynthesis protein